MARDYLSSWFNSFLMTSGRDKYGRLRVDVAQTGFFEGRVRNSGPPYAGFLLPVICKSGTIFAYIIDGARKAFSYNPDGTLAAITQEAL